MYEDSARLCLYHVHATFYRQGMNGRHDVSVGRFNISDTPSELKFLERTGN